MPALLRKKRLIGRGGLQIACEQFLAQLPQLLAAFVVASLATDLIDRERSEAADVLELVKLLFRVVLSLHAAHATGARLALPTVVGARLFVLIIGHAARQPPAGLLLTDVRPRELLLEDRKQAPEDRVVLPEEVRLRDAARVHGCEHDARVFVEALVELTHHHDVADLTVLVGLRPVELTTVEHGDGILHAMREALELPEVCQGQDLAPQLGVVDGGGDGAQDDAPSGFHGAPLQVVQEQVDEQKVAEVVGSEAQLVTVGGPTRATAREQTGQEGAALVGVREVHGRIANQGVQGLAQGLEQIDELTDAAVGG
eukprot:CAMPEP_0177204286 /NCGR_PEP_ID=MMETSP0367-20130122/28260_1 /TAXON_ID=447022 ORGANISM="Scrippsiella hangoei-like, Strain SHHI-4" /NCGR_SAMPLE_ID=MMETSP0367 /ASSEMBLY_ACC=CAM_ASM_000362 /LENGTH=312 /DNA_ID=CAMNT_0018652959 /DNA_START=269 /DNA_END=1208 /DNA_ORIENTATION=+